MIWDVEEATAGNVTDVTKFALKKKNGENRRSPVRSFGDGFHTISRTNECHVSPTVGE